MLRHRKRRELESLKKVLILTLILTLMPTLGETLAAEKVIAPVELAPTEVPEPDLTVDGSDILLFLVAPSWISTRSFGDSFVRIQRKQEVSYTVESRLGSPQTQRRVDCRLRCNNFEDGCGIGTGIPIR